MHHHEMTKDNTINLNIRLMYCDLLAESLSKR